MAAYQRVIVDAERNKASLMENVEPRKLVQTCRTGGDHTGALEFARLSVGLASSLEWIHVDRKQ